MTLITIGGLYEYDNDIFNDFVLPEDLQPMREDVLNEIMMECSDLEVLIPEPDIMRLAIGVFCRKNALRWQKLYDTTQFKYNPIWNKDGTVKETEKRELTNSAVTDQTAGGTAQHNVAGFNTNDTATDYTDTTSSTGHLTGSGREDEGITRERVEAGNIGVTTTQQMIKEEREVWQFTIIDTIVQDFKRRFCLLIY